MKPTPFLRRFLAIAGSVALTITHAHAATGTWTQTTAGPFNWDDLANWSSGAGPIADGADFTANFTANITAAQVVNLSAAKTIGNITFTDSTTSSHDLTISGANLLTLDRTDATAPTINVTQSGRTLTISSQIAGNDGLIKSGAGILIFGGNNIISGNAVVNGGTLQLSGNNLFGDITVNGATLTSGGTAVGPGTLGAAGGTITFTGTSFYNPQRDLVGAYNKNVNISSGTTTFQQSTQYYHETFSGVLSGAGTLVKNDGNGILTFSNAANTFTGAISLGAGTGGLVVNSLADSANAITFNGNTGALSLGAGTASSLLFDIGGRQIVLAHTNGGEITNNNGSASNTIIINTNLGFSGVGTRNLELGGSNIGANAFNGDITNNGGSAVSVTKSGAGTWHISGDMSNTGGLTVNNGGALTLSGTNTYSGNTNFTGVGAQLILAGSQAASANTSFFMNTSASSASSLIRFLDDTGNVNGGTATFAGTYRLQSNNTAGVTNTFFVGNNNTANGGTSTGTTTGSTLTIGTLNWNTVAAGTTKVGEIPIQGVNGYRLQINNVVLYNGSSMAAAQINNTTFYPTSANVTLGTVTMASGNTVSGAIPNLVLDGTSSDNRITGAISNASDVGTTLRPVNLVKSSTSTWNLSGTNTYTGTTTVSGGRLRITGDSSAATGNVSVTGGALGGNGGSLGGAVTVSSTGGINLADGSVGNLTLGSTLNITGALGANSLTFDLGNTTSTSDSLVVAGATTVTTTGAAVINVNQLGGSAGRSATTYTLIGGAGTLGATDFAKFSLATTKAFGQTYSLTNTGDDLQLVATNVTGAVAANTIHNVVSGSWQATGSFTGAAVPDYQSNVIINSAVGTTPLNGSTNINSLTFGTSATTAVTISPGTASAQTNASMLVIEAGAANGNAAGNGHHPE